LAKQLTGDLAPSAPSNNLPAISEKQDQKVQEDHGSVIHLTFDECSELEELGSIYAISTTDFATLHLDWALVLVSQPGLKPSNMFRIKTQILHPILGLSKGKNGAAIATCTGSNKTNHGIISSSSTLLKLESSQTYLNVLTVELEGIIGKYCFLGRIRILTSSRIR
jgi:hypothetical protein